MYATLPDCDSFQDPFVAGTFGLAATKELGIAVSTDAIRNGPAELLQTMLTLADATDGNAVLMLGAVKSSRLDPSATSAPRVSPGWRTYFASFACY